MILVKSSAKFFWVVMAFWFVTHPQEAETANAVCAGNACVQDTVSTQPTRDEWLAKDKTQHFVVSALLAGFGFAILREPLGRSEKQSFYFSGGVVLSVGIGKELYDLKKPKGHASFKDLAADILGIGITLFLIKTI